MGATPEQQDDLTKKEQEAIIEALTPEEKQQLEAIKENLKKRGTSEHALSFKLAQAEACGIVTNVICQTFTMPDGGTVAVPDPEPNREAVLSAVTKAVEQVRERILNNPVFERYA